MKRKTIRPGRRQRIYNKQAGLCYYCGRYLPLSAITIDHKLPLSRGGMDAKKNWVVACDGCNNAKGDMTVGDFMAVLQKQKKPRQPFD